MWAPRELSDSVVVARDDDHGALCRGADIKGADDAVHACGGDDIGAVFVPIVSQGFGGGILHGYFGPQGVNGDGEG